MATSQYTDAMEAYNRAVNLNPNDPQIWCSLGVLYYAFGQYKEALGVLTRSVKLCPTMADAWYNIGALYDMCNQREDAQLAYQKARENGLVERFAKAGIVSSGGTSFEDSMFEGGSQYQSQPGAHYMTRGVGLYGIGTGSRGTAGGIEGDRESELRGMHGDGTGGSVSDGTGVMSGTSTEGSPSANSSAIGLGDVTTV